MSISKIAVISFGVLSCLGIFGCGEPEGSSKVGPNASNGSNASNTSYGSNGSNGSNGSSGDPSGPVANPDSVRTNQGEPVSVFPLVNDSHPTDKLLSLESIGEPGQGTAAVDGEEVVYRPNPTFAGEDFVEYTVVDTSGRSAVGTIQIDVNATPMANDDAISIVPGQANELDVLGNDSDPDSEMLAIVGVSDPVHGEAIVDGPNVVYTPSATFTDTDEFTYTIEDAFGASASATVQVYSNGPLATDDAVLVVTGGATTLDVIANDSDPDDDALTLVRASAPLLGTVAVENNQLVYEVAVDTAGPDQFDYTISDGQSEATATVVLELNNPPAAEPDQLRTVIDTTAVLPVLLNDSDFDSDALQVTGVGLPASGVATPNGATITYVPNAGFDGTDSFTYTITDARGATATATVTVDVMPPDVITSLSLAGARTCLTRADGSLDCWGGTVARGPTGTGMKWLEVDIDAQICAIRDDHTLWCWDWGMDNPSQVGTDSDWRTVETDSQHTCAIKTDGSLWCWGSGRDYVLGNGSEQDLAVPTQVGTGTDWTEIATDSDEMCGIRGVGELWCWGDGFGAGFGNPTQEISPTQWGTDTDWSSPAMGGAYVCVIRPRGAYCYGGIGDMVNYYGPYPSLEIPGDWRLLAARRDNSCAITPADTLFCWGDNEWGAVGDGTTDDRPWAVQVGTDADWDTVDVGNQHVCAYKRRGTEVYCWGRNDQGQLNVPLIDNTVPTQVGTDADWDVVHSGYQQTCALKLDGTRWCWGANDDGQLGDSTTERRDAPVQVDQRTDWSELAMGLRHGCGLLDDGSIWCWGKQDIPNSAPVLTTPVEVGGQTSWTALSAGTWESCALSVAGDYWCWGHNSYLPDAASPTLRDANTDWDYVAGDGVRCGLRGGEIWCLTDTSMEQYGTASDWRSLSINRARMCGLKNDDSLWCGQTLTGTSTEVAPGTSWSSISREYGAHMCAIDSTQKLFCWGWNSAGQLGLGHTTGSTTPAQVGSEDWKQVSTGQTHTCAVRADSTLWCWGDNTHEQLGIGHNWRTTPAPVP